MATGDLYVYTGGMKASDRAYSALREEIVSGVLPAGTLLAEVEQSERLGVSRTPVREAISRLVADGLAVASTGRGTVVSSISLDDVEHLFELRIPLEVQAAKLAAQRAEPAVFAALAGQFADVAAAGVTSSASYYPLAEALDRTIDDAVANPYLGTALKGLRLHLVRVRRLAQDQPGRLTESAGEHQSICAAIAAGDAGLAGAATEVHLRRSLAYITDAARRGTEEPS